MNMHYYLLAYLILLFTHSWQRIHVFAWFHVRQEIFSAYSLLDGDWLTYDAYIKPPNRLTLNVIPNLSITITLISYLL